jgi:hypothetical protein
MNLNLLNDPNLALDIADLPEFREQWLKQQSLFTFCITIIFGRRCELTS